MKVFKCIFTDEDGDLLLRFAAVKNKKELLSEFPNYYLEKAEDVTEKICIDDFHLEAVLMQAKYDEAEIALISALVRVHEQALESKNKNCEKE